MATTRYGTRTLNCVTAIPGTTFKYGFYTNLERAGDLTALGQTPAMVNGDYVPGLVLGANAPKPARMKLYRSASRASTTASGGNAAGGFDSSWCGSDALDTAKAAGWKLVKMYKRRLGTSTARTVAVYITIAGVNTDTGADAGPTIKYAWRLHRGSYERITAADRTALGLKEATGNDRDLVWGVRYPSPPTARFVAVSASGSLQTITVIVDPSKLDSLPSGWSPGSVSA